MTKEEKAVYMKAWRLAHKEERAAYDKAYKAAHREEHSETRAANKRRYYEANRERFLARARQRREGLRDEDVKDYALQLNYGITLDEYNSMFQAQNGLCYICHRPERRIDYRTGKVMALSVDHNHSTGSIRKLLCCGCNFQVGNTEMKPGYAEAMIDQTKAQLFLDYLEEHAL